MAERTILISDVGVDMPTLAHALGVTVPQLIIAAWREVAGDHADSGDYLARLTPESAIEYPFQGNPDVTAVVNTSSHADFLERGRAGFHLASRWARWMIGKAGNLYARVPFRVAGPARGAGAGSSSSLRRPNARMPKQVYDLARQLQNYQTSRQRLVGFGGRYKQSKSYAFYGKAFGVMPPQIASERGYEWKASQFEGLFRSTMPTPQGGRHTEYMTIRTITPDSKGWYIPPTPPRRFAERALEQAMPAIDEVVQAAVAQDLSAAVMSAMGPLL